MYRTAHEKTWINSGSRKWFCAFNNLLRTDSVLEQRVRSEGRTACCGVGAGVRAAELRWGPAGCISTSCLVEGFTTVR